MWQAYLGDFILFNVTFLCDHNVFMTLDLCLVLLTYEQYVVCKNNFGIRVTLKCGLID